MNSALRYTFESTIAELPEDHQRALRTLFDAISDLNGANEINSPAIQNLQKQVTALQKSATAVAAPSTPTDPPLFQNPEIGITPAVIQGRAGMSPIGTTTPNTGSVGNTQASFAPNAYQSGVNLQDSSPTYAVQNYDYGGFVAFNNDSGAVVLLNSNVTANFQCIVTNSDSGPFKLIPTSGSVNGQPFITLQAGADAFVAFDGANWSAAYFSGQVPATLVPTPGEYVTGFQAGNGQFSVNAVPGITATITLASITKLVVTGGLITGVI